MWWKRRPTRTNALVGTPPRRGVLQNAPWWGMAAVLAGAVLIGLWFSLVGYTLAAFVIIDTATGWARRAKTRT